MYKTLPSLSFSDFLLGGDGPVARKLTLALQLTSDHIAMTDHQPKSLLECEQYSPRHLIGLIPPPESCQTRALASHQLLPALHHFGGVAKFVWVGHGDLHWYPLL